MAEAFLGEIRRFAFDFVPKGWAVCDGQLMPVNQNQALFSLLNYTYGGSGAQFALPNLQNRTAVSQGGSAGPIGKSGGGTGPSQPYLTIVFAISLNGDFPSPGR